MKKSILCVDDNERNLKILEELLGQDYSLAFARTGDEALNAVGSVLPDLILLDVMMPGTDGLSVCRSLKAASDTAAIPVVFVTGRARPEDHAEGLAAGADTYLIKPFDPDVLLDLVERHLVEPTS